MQNSSRHKTLLLKKTKTLNLQSLRKEMHQTMEKQRTIL